MVDHRYHDRLVFHQYLLHHHNPQPVLMVDYQIIQNLLVYHQYHRQMWIFSPQFPSKEISIKINLFGLFTVGILVRTSPRNIF